MSKTYMTPRGPVVVLPPFYLASCDGCGWIGSSGDCGTDYWGDDSDVYCPTCHRSGADCGTYASQVEAQERLTKSKSR
jgi:hypothetical protein